MPYADAHMLRRQQDFMSARQPSRTSPTSSMRTSNNNHNSTGSATTAWQEWSARATATMDANTSSRGPPRYKSLENPTPYCWMCGKTCTAYGWCQVNSSLVHRISFYPASLFTLCSTCGKAMSLAPGASLVDVVQRCNPTSYTKQHSHAFVSFLREYMITLEAIHLDMEDEMAQGTLSSSYGHRATTPTRSTTAVAGSVRRDQIMLHPVAIDSLMRCLSEALTDREALTLKEAHLLMSEGASLQVQADQAAVGMQHQQRSGAGVPPASRGSPGLSSRRHQSPEQQYIRSHPLLGVGGSDGLFATSSTPAPRHVTGVVQSPLDAPSFASAAPRAAPSRDQEVIVVNGRRFVATDDNGNGVEAPTPRHNPATAALPTANGTTARLLEAAEEWASQEQEFKLREEDWNAERDELKRHLAAAQNDARILRERMAVKDKECDSLILRTSQLSERLALLDSSSTLQAHMRLMSTMARTVATLAADTTAEKAKLFAEASLVVVRQSVATARQVKKLKEELEQTRLHVRQQQKMLEASRRAVLNSWSEKAGIATEPAPAIGSMAPSTPHRGVTFASQVFGLHQPTAASAIGAIDESEETTLF